MPLSLIIFILYAKFLKDLFEVITKPMKKDIHPQYNSNTTATCACGNTFQTGSTQDEIKTELCYACHPFYTGKQKLVDTARRVEKFQAKVAAQATVSQTRKGKTAKRLAKKTKKIASSSTEAPADKENTETKEITKKIENAESIETKNLENKDEK